MKRVILGIVSICMLLTGCAKNNESKQDQSAIEENNSTAIETESNEVDVTDAPTEEDIAAAEKALEKYMCEFDPDEYATLDDPKLQEYIQDKIHTDLVSEFESEDYIINNVNTLYISKEYLEELEYNSKDNVFFGYTLSELDQQFQGKKYVFTINDKGETVVEEFEEYSDDTYNKALRNVAIGTGVILVCVTVSAVTGGLGAAPVSMVFAASAKTGATMALSAGLFSSVFAGTLKAIETGDPEEALKAAALSGSNSFKWGAIAGALIGGISEASALYSASHVASEGQTIYSYRDAEISALERYGGRGQATYLGGKEVPYGTAGATRPDVVRTVGDHLEAIEIKFYDLSNQNNLNELYRELQREISARVAELPAGTTQRIVLDVTGKGYSEDMINNVITVIQGKLYDIYPNIPVDVWGL